jgi:tetratricopeptide (TPR) repeat protein
MQSSEARQLEIGQYYTIAIDALYSIGKEYYILGKSGDAQHLLRTSLQLLETSEVNPGQRLKLLLLYGQVLIVDHLLTRGRGDVNLLFSLLLNTRQAAEKAQDQQGIADALSLLGQAHYFTAIVSGAIIDNPQSGKYDQALAYQQQALDLRETLHDTRGISESYFQIGVIYERWQQYDRALEYYSKARQIAEKSDHLFERTEPARHFAINALRQGKLDQALTLALQALSLREEARFKPYLPLDHLLLRDIYLAKGDTDQAQLHIQKATALAEEIGYPMLVSFIPDIRARLTVQLEQDR